MGFDSIWHWLLLLVIVLVIFGTSKLTKIGEYNTYRAGMLLNHRPDGSFTNW